MSNLTSQVSSGPALFVARANRLADTSGQVKKDRQSKPRMSPTSGAIVRR
jgi:hypothetical protein